MLKKKKTLVTLGTGLILAKNGEGDWGKYPNEKGQKSWFQSDALSLISFAFSRK
jgi:hypothetical protein